MSQAPVFSLPTEPLLELPTETLRRQSVHAEMRDWLEAILEQGTVLERGDALFRSLRKHVLGDGLAPRLRALSASACRGETQGVAALAALLTVRAPGDEVIEALREFSSLHRMGQRYNTRLGRGERLEPAESSILDAATAIDAIYRASPDSQKISTSALPHPRDVGVAGSCRKVFARIVDELQIKGNLAREDIELFARVANIELSAAEQRASALAGSINPYSARHVSQVMPILGALDTEVQSMRAFTSLLAADASVSHFREQRPNFADQMDEREAELLLDRTGTEELLWPLRRLLLALRRNPLTLRELSFYLSHLYRLGEVLVAARARKHSFDPFEGSLMILEFAKDRALRLPVGERVSMAILEAIATERLEKFEFVDGEVILPMDPSAARRIAPGVGLPLPPVSEAGEVEPDERQSVKDLVLDSINNVSILAGLLKNSKVVSTPGMVELIIMRSRAMVILETICQQRHLHSGYANKGVPVALLRSPMRIPIKTLRKFINVRFVNKLELKRISLDSSSVRREVADEVVAYLKSLN
jgi:hypothetical protein